MLKILIILNLIFVSSCTSNRIKKSQKADLVDVFEVDDNIQKEFLTSSKPHVKPNTKVKQVAKPKKNTRNNDVVKSKPKIEEKFIDVKVINDEVADVKVDPQTLDDYPKDFIKYNKQFKKYWTNQSPLYFKGEKFKFEISWSIFKAGNVEIETLGDLFVGEKEVIGYKAVMESADYFESVYKIKDFIESYVDRETFLPVKFIMQQRESGQSVDDLQLFDSEKLKTYFWYNRVKTGKNKKEKKEEYTPKYFTDSFSALQFIRGIDLKIGEDFVIPVVTRTKVWLLKAQIDKVEEIEVMGKKVNAFKIKAETQFPGVLKKSGDIIFWYSADNLKKLLKFEAKIKIGTVKGELIDYTAGKN